ncbi:MAG: hypothetical protein LBV02_05000 [Bacteroidales bacterium]|nr:hypothetical protein [Bacteroidales bacterium]
MEILNEIKEYYTSFSYCDIDDEYLFHPFLQYHHIESDVNIIPVDIARNIMNEPKSYPRIIASIAEKYCRLYANENMKIVGKIANENNWFG